MQPDSQPRNDLSNPPESVATGHKSRHVAILSNLPFLGRSALLSRIQQVATQAPPSAQFPRLTAFLKVWKWIAAYLRDCFHKDAPYQSYPTGKTGIFALSAPPEGGLLKIAVAADWGTGTLEAETVNENIKASAPHYTLHLGDVYYMGEASEIAENCLGKPTKKYSGVLWHKGSLGSFALMGNHEMYSGGDAYFKTFLPTLGLLNAAQVVEDPQSASYFCLEAEHWLILGLDTGYHSGGTPVFASVPGLKAIPFLNVDARFDDKMIAWLKQTIQRLRDKGSAGKSVLLLTHHQPVSSFDHPFKKPVKQLADLGFLNGREFVWLYGHEHRLAVYQQQAISNTLKAYPRCIGHGGMPVDVTRLAEPDSDLLYYDPRDHAIDNKDPKTRVGYNGHVMLLLDGPKLTLEYRDIVNNALILTECFTPQPGGALQYSSSKPPDSPLASGQQPNPSRS